MDPTTGDHTQTVECMWQSLKESIKAKKSPAKTYSSIRWSLREGEVVRRPPKNLFSVLLYDTRIIYPGEGYNTYIDSVRPSIQSESPTVRPSGISCRSPPRHRARIATLSDDDS